MNLSAQIEALQRKKSAAGKTVAADETPKDTDSASMSHLLQELVKRTGQDVSMKDLQDLVGRESGNPSAEKKTDKQAKQTDFDRFKATESAKFKGISMSDEEIASVVNSRWEAKKKADEAAAAMKEKKRKGPIEPEKWSKELLTNIMEEAGLPKGSKKRMASRIMLVPVSDDEDEDD